MLDAQTVNRVRPLIQEAKLALKMNDGLHQENVARVCQRASERAQEKCAKNGSERDDHQTIGRAVSVQREH